MENAGYSMCECAFMLVALCLKLGEDFYCEQPFICVSYYEHWAECLHEVTSVYLSV